MRSLFPPGDSSWSNRQPQSRWREFAYVFHQIQRAIEPFIPIREVLGHWNEIARALAENQRKRKIQTTKLFTGKIS